MKCKKSSSKLTVRFWLLFHHLNLRYKLHFIYFVFPSKIFKFRQNCWHRLRDITSFVKRLGSSLSHVLNLCLNFCNIVSWICIKRNHTPFGYLVYKFRRIKGAANFISSSSKYEKRLLPRCIHHFKPDIINNMDHMRISGNELSSVTLSQIK